MNGGSHTNFDAAAFTVGAAGGALSIAGALIAGARNCAIAAEANYDAWDREEARTGLYLSEQLRARDHALLLRTAAELHAARGRIASLERDNAVMRARRLPR